MRVDCRIYQTALEKCKWAWKNQNLNDPHTAIASMSLASGIPVIVVAIYANKHILDTPVSLDNLIKFYGYTEILE